MAVADLTTLAGRGGAAVRLMPLLLRTEVRRPAAWIAAGCGAVSGVCEEPFGAVAAAALTTVAGLGDTPAAWPTLARGVVRGLRVVVPMAACIVMAGLGRGPTAPWACLGMLLAAATAAAVRSPTTTDADAATVTLVCAAAALAAASLLGVGGAAGAAVVAIVWLAGAGLAAWWERRAARSADDGDPLPRAAGATLERGPLPASGPTRRLLGLAAMVSTLAAMAGGLLLSPEHAAAATAVTLAWFASLAIPAALLQDGDAVRADWDRVFRSSAAGESQRRWPRLGWLRFAARVVAGHAAILAWPVLVALVVGLASPAAARPAGISLAAVAAAAAAVMAVAFVCARLSSPGETAFAVTAALLVGCLWLTPRGVGEEPNPQQAPVLPPARESRC